jgi:phage terminase small subunit
MAGRTQNVELNDQVELFIQCYLANGHHGANAALEAGYAKSNARGQASRLLTDARVQKRITELNSVTAHHLGITRAEIMRRLNNQSGFDVRKLYLKDGDLKRIIDLDDATAAGIAGIEVTSILEGMGKVTKIKIRDTRAATDSLNKMLGWNAPEKVDHTIEDNTDDDEGVAKLNQNERLMYLKLKQKMKADDSAGGEG